MKRLILILFTSLVFWSCVTTDDDYAECYVYNQTVGKGYTMPDNLTTGNYIFTTTQQWETFLNELDPNAMSFIVDTNIDFNSKQLIVVVGQEHPHTGCQKTIYSMNRSGNKINVYTIEDCGNSGYTQNIKPFHIVAMDKSSLPIEFHSN